MSFSRTLLPDPATYFEVRGQELSGSRGSKWKTTSCIFHGGSDSMRINTATGAWVCMACNEKGGDVLAYQMAATGAEFVDAAKAIGAWVDDGKPYTPIGSRPTRDAGGATAPDASTVRCRSRTSIGSAFPVSHDLTRSNRPVRTRTPGGVAGVAEHRSAPLCRSVLPRRIAA